MDLHENITDGRAAVHPQFRQGTGGIGIHHPHQIGGLIGDALQHRPGDMGLGAAPCQAYDGAPGVHIPIGRAQTGKGRHHHNAAAVRHALRQPVTLRSALDQPQLVPEPLDGAACVEHAALQGVDGFPRHLPAHTGHKAAAGPHRRIAHVHQGKAAGPVGVLRLTGSKAGLSEQGGLLIARAAAHRDPRQILQSRQAGSQMAVDLAVGLRLRQQVHGDVQRGTERRVPLQGMDIEQHGTAGVGIVRHMGLPAGQVPDKPAVHRPGAQFSPLRPLADAGNVVHDPLQLRTGKIGVDQQAGLFRHRFSKAVGLQPVADLRRTAALPHNGIVHRLSCPAVPQDRRLPLVGNADAGNGLGVNMGGVYSLRQRPDRGGPDLHGIVLHPSRLREDLPEGILGL